MFNDKINRLVADIEDWMIEHRRNIHKYPEPSRKEYKTSSKVVSVLESLGLEVEKGYYTTGVVGIIRGKEGGRTLGLRFDMDALEMDELTNLPFASKNKGVMHACGHDGHTAIGLGVAKLLIQLRDEIKGNIKLIFQPAEEDAPNGGGAKYMIEDGVLKNPNVDAMVGLHLWPALKLGTVGTKVGPIMASSDPFTIEIIGKGAHASLPQEAVDPIVIGSQIVNNLQTIVSRNVDPFEQAVLTIGKFIGGTRYNTIPEKVTLEGTVRTYNEKIRKKVYTRIKEIVEKTAELMGGKATLNYNFGYPATINDEKMVELARKAIKDILGENNYVEIERPATGGEDFAYFAKEVPSVYMWVGYGKENEDVYPPHSPRFDFDEKALSIAVKVLVKLALKWGKVKENDKCN
ncbi:M20 metallopeptidase family protein [Thermohalobacter berrensis]|uniref:Peptidase M20 dimerisation domain-containing protein n=1 Tax=Thermohalobacter berrensis TaxID=99594 RepID=A0A419SZE4_9FIRM|nr:amidohydrolase [Thermohalobacter berrensis]RKD30539.1 hypothetical protein BET03_04160 [Thermohalobacter berrensis]